MRSDLATATERTECRQVELAFVDPLLGSPCAVVTRAAARPARIGLCAVHERPNVGTERDGLRAWVARINFRRAVDSAVNHARSARVHLPAAAERRIVGAANANSRVPVRAPKGTSQREHRQGDDTKPNPQCFLTHGSNEIETLATASPVSTPAMMLPTTDLSTQRATAAENPTSAVALTMRPLMSVSMRSVPGPP